MDKNAKTTGFAVCPRGSLLNHDGDEQRANQLSDGRVLCVLCGVCNPLGNKENAVRQLPQEVKTAIAELITAPSSDHEAFKVAAITQGSGVTQGCAGDTERGIPAMAAGCNPEERAPEDVGTAVSLTLGQYSDVTVEISFNGYGVKAAQEAEPSDGEAYDRKRIKCIVPVGADQAAQNLTKCGFRLVASNPDGMMRSLTLVKGRRIPGKPTIIGIRARVTWIVN